MPSGERKGPAVTGAVERVRRPSFKDVEAAYPNRDMSALDLFNELGIGELAGNAAYRNTCAIRMSVALTKAGLALKKGGLRINKGPFKGMRIEPGMRKLADHLVELWGIPEKFDSGTAAVEALSMKQGVVVFFFGETLPLVGAQGHIDLLRASQSVAKACVGSCFFGPRNKIWFWELN
jgi:hypothetical protein